VSRPHRPPFVAAESSPGEITPSTLMTTGRFGWPSFFCVCVSVFCVCTGSFPACFFSFPPSSCVACVSIGELMAVCVRARRGRHFQVRYTHEQRRRGLVKKKTQEIDIPLLCVHTTNQFDRRGPNQPTGLLLNGIVTHTLRERNSRLPYNGRHFLEAKENSCCSTWWCCCYLASV
jgi:hypothetical protein